MFLPIQMYSIWAFSEHYWVHKIIILIGHISSNFLVLRNTNQAPIKLLFFLNRHFNLICQYLDRLCVCIHINIWTHIRLLMSQFLSSACAWSDILTWNDNTGACAFVCVYMYTRKCMNIYMKAYVTVYL